MEKRPVVRWSDRTSCVGCFRWRSFPRETKKETQSPVPARHFKDLILIDNWIGLLAGIVGARRFLFPLGFWYPYWRIADMDFWMVYEAWLFNDGLPQEWFDHPGYLTILLLGNWFRLLHGAGLLDVHALSRCPRQPTRSTPGPRAVRQPEALLSPVLATAFVPALGPCCVD